METASALIFEASLVIVFVIPLALAGLAVIAGLLLAAAVALSIFGSRALVKAGEKVVGDDIFR